VITILRMRSWRLLWFGPAFLACAMVLFAPRPAISSPQSQQTGGAAASRNPATQAAPAARASVPSPASDAPMMISSGDLLTVSVFGAPDYVQEVRVDDNGQVSLPFMGEIKLAGMSVNEAEGLVAKRLAERGVFKDPQVTIVEKEYMAQNVTVIGEVQKPGIYPVTGKRTLFDLISAAGGASTKAGDSAIITHRGHPDAPETIHLTYDANGLQNSNVPVFPGDTIVLSKAGIVYVVGDVRVPTGVVLENPKLTVLKALAMAQGMNPTAAQDKTRIIRHTPSGEENIPVPLKKILAAKAPDPPLYADDILFVPNSAAKSALRRGSEALVQTAVGAAIYAPLY
jgi:polysaccharide export outer membrane protein